MRALEREGWATVTTDVEGEATVLADLADPEAPAQIFDRVGPVEALVACHAVSELGGVLEASAEQIDRVAAELTLRVPLTA